MGTTATHYVAAAALLERLLTDARFRAAFRDDPAGTCRAHGLPHLAEEFERQRALTECEERESRSSLGGILLAVAVEGAGVLDRLRAAAGTEDVAAALERALNADPAAMPAIAD